MILYTRTHIYMAVHVLQVHLQKIQRRWSANKKCALPLSLTLPYMYKFHVLFCTWELRDGFVPYITCRILLKSSWSRSSVSVDVVIHFVDVVTGLHL